jgi:hypothetical protein
MLRPLADLISDLDFDTLHAEQRQAIAEAGEPPAFEGRGIVTSAYDREFPSCWVLMNELARLGVGLPIQAWHRPGELSEGHRALLADLPLDLTFHQIDEDVDGPLPDPFAIKPLVIAQSSLREVLWLDSDCFPLRDPEFLFDDPGYIAKGSLFWHDIMSYWQAMRWHPGSPIWRVFNVLPHDSEEFETGQLLIDKTRCWTEVCLTVHFNRQRDVYHRFVYGDKDTFRMAWMNVAHARGQPIAARDFLTSGTAPYSFMPFGPFSMGASRGTFVCGGGSVVVQRDRDGWPLFNHRAVFKFRSQGNQFNEDVPEEKFYRRHLERLAEHEQALAGRR